MNKSLIILKSILIKMEYTNSLKINIKHLQIIGVLLVLDIITKVWANYQEPETWVGFLYPSYNYVYVLFLEVIIFAILLVVFAMTGAVRFEHLLFVIGVSSNLIERLIFDRITCMIFLPLNYFEDGIMTNLASIYRFAAIIIFISRIKFYN